tara:strand:- start:35 stop:565 length:531 start_codon:yes stop_codon:yes gene_type:complete
MFMAFINILIQNRKATISKDSNKVLLLNSEASNYFVCGRDENLQPFIGIQEDFIPWFPEVNWVEIAIHYKKGYVYLIAGDDDYGNPLFAIGLKIRRKRMIALADPQDKNENKSLNFKVFKILDNRELAISSKNISSDIKITVINNINDIIEREEDEEVFSFEEDDFISDFKKLKMS